jgi:protein gp37
MNVALVQSKLEIMTESELESVVDEGLPIFVRVGLALEELKRRGEYKKSGYTWDKYCQERFGFRSNHADKQIRGAKIVGGLGTTVPTNERQIRPLTNLEPEQQRQAWQQAVESADGQQPTSKQVKQAVRIVKPTMNRVNENIEWAAWSWNPVTGCLHNCAYCYARDIANRFFPQGFEPTYHPERLTAPDNTKLIKPRWPGDIGHRGVFVCSMADLFGKWVPVEWIEAVLDSIRRNAQWTFLLLTKFPIRMAEFNYPPNVWLGTTVDYQHAIHRAQQGFRKIKTSGFEGVCWLSCEPMMERLTFDSLDMFDWLVMGGASKSTQTPEYWPPFGDVLHLYDQAKAYSLPVYMKTNLLRLREYPNGL